MYYGPGDVRIEDLKLPAPGPGEVLVQMLACGICGSDLMDWYTSLKAPVVLGHEPVGTVLAVGEPVDHSLPVLAGDRVFIHHHVPCFTCDLCQRGHYTLCESFKRSRLHPGGFAEQILVPAENARIDLLVIPDHLSTEAATMIEPLACALRGQSRAGVDYKTRLLVLGTGQMGLLHIQAARAKGCRTIVAADPVAARRRLAEQFGANAVAPNGEAVLQAMGGRPDIVIICTGGANALELATEVVADGGVVQLFAPSAPGTVFSLDPNQLFFREVSLQSSYSAGPFETREALRLLASGQVITEGIITHRFPLESTAQALEVARTGQAIKVIVQGSSSIAIKP